MLARYREITFLDCEVSRKAFCQQVRTCLIEEFDNHNIVANDTVKHELLNPLKHAGFLDQNHIENLCRLHNTTQPTKTAHKQNTDTGIFDDQKLFGYAQEAMRYARKSTPGKSDNKDYGDNESLIPENKRDRYREEIRDDRTCRLNRIQCAIGRLEDEWIRKKEQPDFKEVSKIIAGEKDALGNCYEEAILAYVFLENICKEQNIPLDIISLKKPGNHNFVAVNQTRNSDGSYPKDFTDWDKDALIVDPWAKIACKAREYPKEWAKKMEKWNSRGLKIYDASPLSWTDSISENEKNSRMNVFPGAVVKITPSIHFS